MKIKLVLLKNVCSGDLLYTRIIVENSTFFILFSYKISGRLAIFFPPEHEIQKNATAHICKIGYYVMGNSKSVLARECCHGDNRPGMPLHSISHIPSFSVTSLSLCRSFHSLSISPSPQVHRQVYPHVLSTRLYQPLIKIASGGGGARFRRRKRHPLAAAVAVIEYLVPEMLSTGLFV